VKCVFSPLEQFLLTHDTSRILAASKSQDWFYQSWVSEACRISGCVIAPFFVRLRGSKGTADPAHAMNAHSNLLCAREVRLTVVSSRDSSAAKRSPHLPHALIAEEVSDFSFDLT